MNSDAEQGDSKAVQGTRHCFVLCKNVEPGDLSRAEEIVSRIFGPGYSAGITKGDFISVTHGSDDIGVLAHMPAPIPGNEAAENAQGNILWPDGKDEAARHRSHVIVTTIGTGEQTPVESAMAVTRLALVALEVFNGIGVYWGNASVTNSREIFEDFCEGMSEEHLPVPIWLRFQPFHASEDEVGIYTVGMQQFGLMEIEIDRCKMDLQELFDFVSNIAHYLILNGPVIQDGNTVGGSEEERILVKHLPSMNDENQQAYKIVFERD